MMNRKEFYEYVKDNVKDYLPDSYQNGEIRIEEVAKNNGLRLTGISIPQGDQRAVPMVYLDSLYMEYVNGKNLDSCVGDVADMRIEVQDKSLRKESKVVQTKKQYGDFSLTALSFASISIFSG